MFDLEDMTSIVRCIVWPEEFAKFGSLVESDAILVLRGAIDRRPGSEETNLVVNELIPLDDLPARFTKSMIIRLVEERHSPTDVVRLREVLRGYPGNFEVQFQVCLADGSKVYLQNDALRVGLDARNAGPGERPAGSRQFAACGSAPQASFSPATGRRPACHGPPLSGPGRLPGLRAGMDFRIDSARHTRHKRPFVRTGHLYPAYCSCCRPQLKSRDRP